MTSLPITGIYNDGHVAELLEQFRRDPNSVDESWRQFFRFAESIAPQGVGGLPPTVTTDAQFLRLVAGAAALMDAIRIYGHFAVRIDPLGSDPPGAAELQPAFHGVTEEDLKRVPGAALGFDLPTAADVAARLRSLYQSNLGFEFDYIGNESERQWFRTVIEQEGLRRQLSPDEQRTLLRRLTEVDALERFIHRKYVNVKRFSIEGTDALVPMLDIAIHDAATGGAREMVMAMAHRGRINVLAHILGKPYGTVFDEFDGKHADVADSETGDVKYHLGFESERAFEDGRHVRLTLVPDPSHRVPERGLGPHGLLHEEPEPLGMLVDEVEVGLERRPDALPIARGRLEGGPHVPMKRGEVGVEQRKVQLPLRGEVVVEDGLGDAGLLGHRLHGGRVEPRRAEHLARHVQELGPAFRGPHPPPGGCLCR